MSLRNVEINSQEKALGPWSILGRRPRILVFAYGCDPRLGSEEGAGWGLVRTLGEFADCTVLVSPDHAESLLEWKKQHSADWLQFVPVPDLPFAKIAKEKWHRIIIFLAYLVWLGRAYKMGCLLHERHPYDATYHATYSVYWLPTPAARFLIPCVWGPVGGAVTTPFKLWPCLGWMGVFGELLDLIAVRALALWPSTRRTWRNAKERIIQNEETLQMLPEPLQAHSHVLNHVFFADISIPTPRPRKNYLLSIAPLESRKGLRLLIRAMAKTPDDIELIIVGDGPERATLHKMIFRLDLSARVDLLGHISREQLANLLAEAAAVVFTGLREEGGMGLAEAMFSGCPVVVLANGGARTIADSSIDKARVRLIEPSSVSVTAQRLAKAMVYFARHPTVENSTLLDRDTAGKKFENIFLRAIVKDRVDSRR